MLKSLHNMYKKDIGLIPSTAKKKKNPNSQPKTNDKSQCTFLNTSGTPSTFVDSAFLLCLYHD